MNIIKSEVVERKYDVLWDSVDAALSEMVVKPVLVIVNNCEVGSVEDGQLQKMLAGPKLTDNDCNILRLKEGQMMAWHKLREALDPKIIFLVGVSPAQLGISAMFTVNMPNNFNDRYWLPTYALNELEASKELKLQLWNNGMKPLLQDKTYVTF
jgi:hypothetical protein